MNDMAATIVPKSDQMNADDFITGPKTITILRVEVRPNQEQPVMVHYEGDGGKPYKPCKSMCRVMVQAWGADSANYAGKSMTLYRDTEVTWGGVKVGGIRISHMSHIDRDLAMALSMSKSKRQMVMIKRLQQPAAVRDNQEPVAAGQYTLRGETYATPQEWADAVRALVTTKTVAAKFHADRRADLEALCQDPDHSKIGWDLVDHLGKLP